MNQYKYLMSEYGKLKGFGWCRKCKLAWNVVNGFMIPYTESSSMFPICERCFTESSIKDIEKYIDELLAEWAVNDDGLGTYNGLTRDEIRIAARLSVRKLKGK